MSVGENNPTRLILIRRVGPRHCECRCECEPDKIKVVEYYGFKSGRTKSCGCLKRERTIERNKATATRGGLTHTPLGASWCEMMTRCFNKNSKDYPSYGGRGIVPCEALRASPANLLLLIGERPHGTSIDRIDGDTGYWCGKCAECQAGGMKLNVRWATPAQQTRNQITNHFITINDETLCVADWAKRVGVAESAIRLRLKRGWVGKELLLPARTFIKSHRGIHPVT